MSQALLERCRQQRKFRAYQPKFGYSKYYAERNHNEEVRKTLCIDSMLRAQRNYLKMMDRWVGV